MAKKKGRKVSSSKSGGGAGIVLTSDAEMKGAAIGDVEEEEAAVVGASGAEGNDACTLARVLEPSESDWPTGACRSDGCEKDAADLGAEGAPPKEIVEQPLSEEGEAALAGGGDGEPANAKTSATISTPEPEAPTENEEEKKEDSGKDRNDDDDKDGGEEVEEVWELQRILSVDEIVEKSTKCSNSKCKTPAACVWVSNLSPGDEWFSCLDCQAAEFGGFPPADELPLSSMSDDHLETMAKHCSRKKNPMLPDFGGSTLSAETPGKVSKPDLAMITPLPPPEADNDGDDEGEEAWDLTRIFSVEDIKDCPIKCSSDSCSLPAACVWISNQAPTTKWYSCLDCQAKDFGGWPAPDELPVSHLAKDHMDFLAQKCSRNKGIEMPTFSAASPSSGGTTNARATSHSLVTPLPGGLTQDDDDDDKDDDDEGGKVLPKKPPAPAQQQPSKQALAMHQKWQEAAVAMGGKDARIVVSKPKAKELIFEMLENAFRPMNITEIHKALKAIVPSPVLKACLDEMADATNDACPTFDDSDDEHETSKKAAKASKGDSSAASGAATGDRFKASLCFKAGKTSNASLYYVDYSKLKNNGNGLDPHDRNELAAAVASAQAEEAALAATLKQLSDETTQLLSEPTNVEAVARLEVLEAELKVLREKVEAGRKLKVNEKHKLKLKTGIESMAAQWRKRRRICMDFFISIEESSDGSITMKKCLNGDGPIDIDSDEAVAKGAVAFALKKRSAPMLSKKHKAPVSKKLKAPPPGHTGTEALASEDFVAVTLNSQGLVTRVIVNEDAK